MISLETAQIVRVTPPPLQDYPLGVSLKLNRLHVAMCSSDSSGGGDATWLVIRVYKSHIFLNQCINLCMTLQNSFWPQFTSKNQEADRARCVFCFTGFVRKGAPQVDVITIRFAATYTDISGPFQFSLVNYVIYVHSAYMYIITYVTYITIHIYIYTY